MRLQSLLCLLVGYLQIVTAATSYLSLNTLSDKNELREGDSVSELIESSSSGKPVIVFQFIDFSLFDKLVYSEGSYKFLTYLLDHDPVALEGDDEIVSENANLLEIESIDEITPETLSNQFKKEDSVVIVRFEASQYEMSDLDDFLETVFLFLVDAFENIDTLIIQAPRSEHIDATNLFSQESLVASQSKPAIEVNEPLESDKPGKAPSDELSSLWTEGLLSCLLVSLLLVVLLTVAISWISSLDISYGALEKPANPLKKTN